jgi:hypothetical protein
VVCGFAKRTQYVSCFHRLAKLRVRICLQSAQFMLGNSEQNLITLCSACRALCITASFYFVSLCALLPADFSEPCFLTQGLRGRACFFLESYNEKVMADVGIRERFVQDKSVVLHPKCSSCPCSRSRHWPMAFFSDVMRIERLWPKLIGTSLRRKPGLYTERSSAGYELNLSSSQRLWPRCLILLFRPAATLPSLASHGVADSRA